eukprot:1573810-Pyramimonas_sp.AAC.1
MNVTTPSVTTPSLTTPSVTAPSGTAPSCGHCDLTRGAVRTRAKQSHKLFSARDVRARAGVWSVTGGQPQPQPRPREAPAVQARVCVCRACAPACACVCVCACAPACWVGGNVGQYGGKYGE